jgi:hypothetical protein
VIQRLGVELTHEGIQGFIEMWEQEFGERLSPEDARYEATRLLEFFIQLTRLMLRLNSPDGLSQYLLAACANTEGLAQQRKRGDHNAAWREAQMF